MKKLYISGGFYGHYKETIVQKLGTVFNIYDPEKAGLPQFPGAYVHADLVAIQEADLVLAVQGEYPFVYGMAAEVGYSAAINVPVVYVCIRPRIDSFLTGLSRAVFSNLEAACDFILERYA